MLTICSPTLYNSPVVVFGALSLLSRSAHTHVFCFYIYTQQAYKLYTILGHILCLKGQGFSVHLLRGSRMEAKFPDCMLVLGTLFNAQCSIQGQTCLVMNSGLYC